MTASVDGKFLVRCFYEQAINQRDPGACHRLLCPDFRHNGVVRGNDGQAEVVRGFLAGFSDLTHKVEIILAEGDLVAAHQCWSGTHDGPFMGFAATGRTVTFTSTAILRIAGDRIAEAWDVIDMALLSQLQGRS